MKYGVIFNAYFTAENGSGGQGWKLRVVLSQGLVAYRQPVLQARCDAMNHY